MNARKLVLLVFLGCVLAAGVFEASSASTVSGTASPPRVTVSALSAPFTATKSQRRELRRLRRQLRKSPIASIATTATLREARPVPLPEHLGDAWVADAPGGSVCTFIPDPIGGYGASCATQEDLRAGGAITVLGGAGELNNEAIVVLVVPDGGQTPVVTAPDGAQTDKPVDGIGATVVPESSRVTIGGVSLTVPAFEPRCSSNADADFQRCEL